MIRVAVIGAGYWGRNLLRNFDALGALAAFCDLREEARAEFAGLYPGAKPHAGLDELLGDDTIDAVAIATPAATHAELAGRALAAGKHVFVEKPLALDLTEGHTLGEQADRAGLTLMVGHLLLYHPAFVALKGAVDEGRLGSLRYIYSNRLSLGKIRREENALWSFAPHDISMILSLVGATPARAMTIGGTFLSPSVADTTLSHMTFPGGTQAHVFVSWLHPYKDHRMVVVGSEGMAVFHDSQTGSEKLLLYPHSVGWDGDIPSIEKAEAEPIPYGDDEPLAAECQHFVDCVASHIRPRSDAIEALRVLAVLDACQRSMVSGAPADLESDA